MPQSSFYLFRDLAYSAALVWVFFQLQELKSLTSPLRLTYYPLILVWGAAQGIVWTGLWVIAHECGHSAFSRYSGLNDLIGWTIHSVLLTPYFSWKSTHRRHHIYANNMVKDLNYVPPLRDTYAAKLGLAPGVLDEMTEDAPAVLFIRILIQQLIGWNWYILSNITAPPTSVIKKDKSVWRHSHFDPWGSLFRDSEVLAVVLSDIGCLTTIAGLYTLYQKLGSFELVFWFYIVPWTWVNHWIGEHPPLFHFACTGLTVPTIVMITYLHHTHPTLPKFSSEEWTFTLGATATIDRDFGFIGTHFFHHISSDHVIHHLFSKIPHYHAREASNAVIPLLGDQYAGREKLAWSQLKLAFNKCQWVEEDVAKDGVYFKSRSKDKKALWYRGGKSPAPEYRMRESTK